MDHAWVLRAITPKRKSVVLQDRGSMDGVRSLRKEEEMGQGGLALGQGGG